MNHDNSQHHIATLDSPEMNYIFWQVTPHITQWFLISRQNEYANALLLSVILLCKLVPTFVVEVLTCLYIVFQNVRKLSNIAVMITMNKTNGFLMYDRHRNCCNLFIHLTALNEVKVVRTKYG